MGRRGRIDYPGAWHHVTNRSVARRPAFESRRDVRFFLSQVARAVRRGELRVYAFTVLTTHFHLFVRSLEATLAAAMCRIESRYAKWFNRRRGRDGPLFRGRYKSKLVEHEDYRRNVIRYIDDNAVAAGMTERAEHYPYCSAWHVHRDRQPPWLTDPWTPGGRRAGPSGTAGLAPLPWERAIADADAMRSNAYVVERRLTASDEREDPFASLASASGPAVAAWLRQRAAIADGRLPCLPIGAPDVLDREIARLRGETGDPLVLRPRRQAIDGWNAMTAGLLRDLCGSSLEEIASRLRFSVPTARARCRLHHRTLSGSAAYRSAAAVVTTRLLRPA